MRARQNLPVASVIVWQDPKTHSLRDCTIQVDGQEVARLPIFEAQETLGINRPGGVRLSLHAHNVERIDSV